MGPTTAMEMSSAYAAEALSTVANTAAPRNFADFNSNPPIALRKPSRLRLRAMGAKICCSSSPCGLHCMRPVNAMINSCDWCQNRCQCCHSIENKNGRDEPDHSSVQQEPAKNQSCLIGAYLPSCHWLISYLAFFRSPFSSKTTSPTTVLIGLPSFSAAATLAGSSLPARLTPSAMAWIVA